MSEERMGLDATNWVLPSTAGSKYAHAPAWSVHRLSTPQMRPACGVRMPAWDHMTMEGEASGKPPCPKCIRMLRHHLRWLGEWVESYENLTWDEEA